MQKISIITINRNNAEGLDLTIRSVVNQQYDNYEYIIIDGASTDQSLEVVKKYEDQITYWVSEPDKGVYDAMNKGIDVASGDWICFMNSGDIFHDNNVLKSIFIDNFDILLNSDVVYGNTVLVTCLLKFMLYPDPIETMLVNKPFCHQSCFVRTHIQKENKFRLNYKICADYAFFFHLYINKYRFEYVNIIISDFDTIDSLSVNSTNLVIKENYSIRGIVQGKKVNVDVFKLKINKILSRSFDILCSKNACLLNNKIKRMKKRLNVGWVIKR